MSRACGNPIRRTEAGNTGRYAGVGCCRGCSEHLPWRVPRSAQVSVVDDFESYANSAALQAAWVAVAPFTAADVTLDPAGITGKSMSIDYDVSGGANAVEFTFGSDQDFTLRTTVRIIYEATAGSANEDVIFELLDSMDNVLVSARGPGRHEPSATRTWEVEPRAGRRRISAPCARSGSAIARRWRHDGDRHGALRRHQRQLGHVLDLPLLPRRVHRQAVRRVHRRAQWIPDLHDVHRATMLNFDCNDLPHVAQLLPRLHRHLHRRHRACPGSAASAAMAAKRTWATTRSRRDAPPA